MSDENVFFIAVLLIALFTVGDPDLLDAIIHRVGGF